MTQKIIYHTPWPFFGESFGILAAARVRSMETNDVVYVSCWSRHKELAQFFDNITWINAEESERRTLYDNGFKIVDITDYLDLRLHNYVSRYIMWMTNDGSKRPICDVECNIHMNIKQNKGSKNVSVVLSSSTNGNIKHSVLTHMLERADVFYPRAKYRYRLIGYANNNLNPYMDLVRKYDIIDERTLDLTAVEVVKQIQDTVLIMGPHCGLMYPSLGMGLQVWCESSLNYDHNFCLDFNSNRPMRF